MSFVSEEPSDQERLIAESLRRHLGAAMQVKHRLDLLRHLSGELTGVASDLANVCAPTATTLVANAVEELSLAAKLNVELAAALGVN